MPQGPAARVGDPVAHPLPPVLGPGPGSTNVLIGNQPAWRGMPLAAAAGIMAAKAASDATVVTAMAASTAAMGTPGAPAAKAAEVAAEQAATASMTSAMSGAGMGADQHMCATPLAPPVSPPPHSTGMVITGSLTVLINNLPACRMGDTILECLGPPNTIAMGFPTVIIGDSMAAPSPGGAMAAAAQAGVPFVKTSALQELPPLRQEYIKEVEALKKTGEQLQAAGKTPEETARALHQMRRDIGVKYKDLTPPDKLAQIHARNEAKYGDKLGPSVDYLRAKGKSWDEIIESASRTGGADLGLSKPK